MAVLLTAAQFFVGLKIREMTMAPDQPVNTTRTEGGAVYRAGRGVALWRGAVSLVPGYHRTQAAVDALLDVAARGGAMFLAHDTRLNGPALDPGGAILGASAPTLVSVGSDSLSITIGGLPVGYVLSPGDHIGFTFGANPLRYALHRVAIGGTAGGNGRAVVQVSTFIPAGVNSVSAVSLVRPVAKFVLDAAPQYGAGVPLITGGATFSFTQTLR